MRMKALFPLLAPALLVFPAASALSSDVANLPVVTVSPAEQRPHRDSVTEIGETEAEDSVELSARVKGYLTKIAFREGQLVKQGDPLFEIDPREFQAQVDYAKADVARMKAQKDHAAVEEQRQKTLVTQDAVSERDYDRAAANLAKSVADVAAAEATLKLAELDLEYCRIVAPFDGYVGFTAFSAGNVVGPESGPLTNIQRVGRTKVSFNIPENALTRLRENARKSGKPPKDAVVELYDQSGRRIAIRDANGVPKDAVGKIDSFDNRINPKTGTLKIKAVFDDPQRDLLPGSYVKVRLYLEEPRPCVAVPLSAVATDVTGSYAYVVKEDKGNPGVGIVERRLLKDVKARDIERLYLNAGIQPGELLVVSGIQRVRPGAKCSFRMKDGENAAATGATTKP